MTCEIQGTVTGSPGSVRRVVLPISRSAAERLGKRLAISDAPAPQDLMQLNTVLLAYQSSLTSAQERVLNGCGVVPTARLKTTASLVDKLRREPTKLHSIQDIAGLRLICQDRQEQRNLALGLGLYFSLNSESLAYRLVDRNASPSHGYRALHLIVQEDGLPVEIQVRTSLQDSWAQLLEKLSDQWGRGVRYGDVPWAGTEPLTGLGATQSNLWKLVQQLSQVIDEHEHRGDNFRLHELLELAEPLPPEEAEPWQQAKAAWNASHANLAALLDRLDSALI